MEYFYFLFFLGGMFFGIYCIYSALKRGVTFSFKELLSSDSEYRETPLQLVLSGFFMFFVGVYFLYPFILKYCG